jgi:hypothetical protein
MARTRGTRGPITSGADTALGQLAEYYRLGDIGALQFGSAAQPGRERLTTPQEIIAALEARQLLPKTGGAARVSVSYIAEWTDVETGQVVGATRLQIESDQGTPRSTLDSRARREAALALPRYVSEEMIEDRTYKLRLRKIGSIELEPT